MPPIFKHTLIITLNLAIGFVIGVLILLVLDMWYTGGHTQKVVIANCHDEAL